MACRYFGRTLKARTSPFYPVRASGSQEEASTSSQQQAPDPEDNLYEEIEQEDQRAAEHINERARVFDLFPPPPPKLTALEQKQRAYKLSGRPLRQKQVPSQSAPRRRRAGSDRAPLAAVSSPFELMPADLRPTPPLPPICNLPRSSAADKDAQKRVPTISEHYKPLEQGEGIGSYASKVAAAGLGPLPNPRLVVEYHPMVTKARMDRNVAAGYDPTGEWANHSVLAGEDLAHLGDEEEDEDEEDVGAEQDRRSSRAAEDLADNGDFPDMPAEESDEVDWGADFVDEDEETLQDEFGRVLDETIEQRLGPDADDTEGFGVWDGGDDEDFLGPDRGKGRVQDKGSFDNSDDLEDPDALDSAVQEWEKLGKMRKTARN
ncbi:g11169 [Coccomyxa elongata]